MKMKIIILMILMLISINNVSGNDEVGSDEFEYSGTEKSEFIPVHNGAYNNPFSHIYIKDVGTVKKLKRIQTEILISDWMGSALDSQWYNVEYRLSNIGGVIITTGVYGFSKGVDKYYVTAYFDDELTGSGSIALAMTTSIHSGIPSFIRSNRYTSAYDEGSNIKSTDALLYSGTYLLSASSNNLRSDTYYDIEFYNSYNWTNNVSLERLQYNQIRDSGNKTKTKIIINNTVFYNDTSFKDTELNYLHPFYDSNIWNINIENQYGTTKNFDISFDISDIIQPTLITDKTTYNISEQITISYTNIQKIYDECDNTLCESPYYISVLTQSDDYGYEYNKIWESVIPFYYTEYGGTKVYEDGSFTINTSFLYPETDYILGLCGNHGNTRLQDENLLYSKNFYVYPANEYLSISCDDETGCFIYQGEKLNIYYKINNNSNIIIKDHDNNIINTYYNIIGIGTLIYNIPDDEHHLLSYPNWKVYLNNTDYTTSFNRGVTVYWSQFETPTGTPTPYPTDTPDINISDQLDNLTVEIQPLKELLYGFVYIVIDNPDYDKDNIINENEINHWFNSLIPMCLFLLLIILYIGLKKNRD